MIELLNKLFPLQRTLLSDDNELVLKIINEQIPLKVHRYRSGTQCYDWTIPKKWTVNQGILKNKKGDVIVNSKDNILHLLNYSSSFNGLISLDELSKHIYYDETLPGVIPYRTSYYSDNWGFCISNNHFKQLTDDEYYVDINTSFENGDLLIGESVIKGETDREIILSSYYCHPMQVNDGLSGVLLLIKLYNGLKNKNLKYTYRFLFWPETIGAITALSQQLLYPENIEYALVATTVGYGEGVYYKKTYLGNHSLDNVVEDIVEGVNVRPFQPTGSDERQFSSNGIRVPCGVLTAVPYEQYAEYHTSFDNIDLISFDTIDRMAEIYVNVILCYEKYSKYRLSIDGGEVFLSKYDLYRQVGVPGNTANSILRNWILFYCNGKNNIKDIAKLTDSTEELIQELISIYKEKGIIQEN